MKLDFIICGSLNNAFLSQIAFFRLCLDALGSDYKNARLVAVFGDHSEEVIPTRWKPHFKNIEVVWSHPVWEINPDHRAQHYLRFENMRPDADLVIICDADIALLRPFPDLIKMCKRQPAVFGVIAHGHFSHKNIGKNNKRIAFLGYAIIRFIQREWPGFFKQLKKIQNSIKSIFANFYRSKDKNNNPTQEWSEIAKETIGHDIQMKYQYILNSKEAIKEAPFYINYGFLASTPKLLKNLYTCDIEIVDTVANYVGSFWAPQVSLALAIEKLNLPSYPLSVHYNYPNYKIMDERYPGELENIIVLHYLNTDYFDRHLIFTSEKHFGKFINMRLDGSSLVFQEHVIKLTRGKYPF